MPRLMQRAMLRAMDSTSLGHSARGKALHPRETFPERRETSLAHRAT